ncbi:hypothetical protein CHS0354_025081 [Potamilus streckersoni]|uniref:Spatacsin C-terminal domain-containing protein n=1 Tax=Potamilus streckersoni TaxID=2493646 RepID=A0AAE0T909_9BIVA|nr:hypothetical protein CHS0354_025081 [Potamilus streckersoni]
MADSTKVKEVQIDNYIRCFLYKFRKELNTDLIRNIHQSLIHCMIILELTDGSVNLINLVDQDKEFDSLHYHSILLRDEGESLSQSKTGEFMFCAVTTNFDLQVYAIKENQLIVSAQGNLAALLQGSNKMESAELQSFIGDHISVTINKKILLTVFIENVGLKFISCIDLPEVQGETTIVQFVSDLAVILHREESKLYFHSILDGSLFTTLDLKGLSVSRKSIVVWRISEDLKTLLVTHDKNQILYIDIEKYVNSFPYSVKNEIVRLGDSALTLPSRLSTCQFGDLTWREKLLFLNSSQMESNSIPWYKTSGDSCNKFHQGRQIKQKFRVTGFHVKGKEKTTSLNDHFATNLCLPNSLVNSQIKEITLGPLKILVILQKNQVSYLCICDVGTQNWITQRINAEEHIILSRNPSMPHLVMTPNHLICLVTDSSLKQEEFVSELMVYSGASIADAVCHMNKWGRCSIPIHTLEIGLKHRQLDTVSFFFKSKENLLSRIKLKVSSPCSPTRSFVPVHDHYGNITQLEVALDLVLQSAESSIVDIHSIRFGQELLDLILDFLYGLLLDALGVKETLENSLGNEDEKEDLQKAIEKLLDYISEARECVHRLDARQQGSPSQSLDMKQEVEKLTERGNNENQDEVDGGHSDWKSMHVETVIEEGILNNQIPELQIHLQERRESAKGEFLCLKNTGIIKALKHLAAGNIRIAKKLISNLGIDVTSKLWEIALFASDVTLRQVIISELKSMSVLSKDQVSMVMFLEQLTQLLLSKTFEKGIMSPQDYHSDDTRLANFSITAAKYHLIPDWVQAKETSLNMDSLEIPTQEVDKQEKIPSQDSTDKEPQIQDVVLLDWVQNWDQDARDLILLDFYIKQKDKDFLIGGFRADILWAYLLSHDMISVAVAWIESSFQPSSPQPSWPVSSVGPVPMEFVDNLQSCPTHRSHILLKTFASFGIFPRDALADFHKLLIHLALCGGVLTVPHPVSKSIFMNVDQFHMDMVQHCVHKNLPDLLWDYSHIHKLSTAFLQTLEQGFSIQTWLPLFTSFFCLSGKNKDTPAIYQASLYNTEFVWGPHYSSVSSLIQGGHVLAAMATLMYSAEPIHQVTNVAHALKSFDNLPSEVVEVAVKSYPKLHAALFPTSVQDSGQKDVTVYQLLVGNAPFDPSRLFGWQTTNDCAGEDCRSIMPYFSEPELTSRFTYSEHLSYTYYLKQARPSFAFVAFLAEELKSGAATVPYKRLMTAVGTSLWMGVKHLHHPDISSACVVFQELLGYESLMLRTYLQVGTEIQAHKNSAVMGQFEKRREQIKMNEKETVELLLKCVQNHRKYGSTVLQVLEAAILASIVRDGIAQNGFEAAQRWTVALLFSQLIGLPYSTVFLESCAQANRWLPFIWFAHIHQYPKEQLKNVLHLFKSPNLQEHLNYVLENADIRSAEEEVKKRLVKQSAEERRKDVRTLLYARIGLAPEKFSDESSSDETPVSEMQSQDTEDEVDEDVKISEESAPSDVFGIVFAANSHPFPWKALLAYSVTLRNPIFAELAACTKGSSVLPCLCGWLVSMLTVAKHQSFLEEHGKVFWKYNLQTIDALIDLYIRNKWGSTLATGFDIFQPISPLLPFLKFYASFTEKKDYNSCKMLLEEFKEAMYCFHHESYSSTESLGPPQSLIGDSSWLEQVTYKILHYMLTNTPSVYEVLQLLKLLESESITLVFSFEVPDFHKLYQLVQLIQKTQLRHVNFSCLLLPGTTQYHEECDRIISHMMSQQQYQEARNLAQLTGSSTDHVTLEQVLNEKNKIQGIRIWNSPQVRINFYRECSRTFQKYKVTPTRVAEFFEDEIQQTDDACEKAYLYELCLDSISGDLDMHDRSLTMQLYHNMWTFRIKHKVQQIETGQSSDILADDLFAVETSSEKQISKQQQQQQNKRELICIGKMPHIIDQPILGSDKEETALLMLIGELLDAGCIKEGCHVATEFTIYSQDLAIILTCIRLSLRTINTSSIDPEMVQLITSDSNKTRRLSLVAVPMLKTSSSLSLMSNVPPSLDFLTADKEEVLETMERLCKHCNHGQQFCRRIITAFRVSSVLDMKYEDVVTSDEFEILKMLLKLNCSQKFRLATEHLSTSLLSPNKVAGFLSDSIVQSYQSSLYGDSKGASQGELLLSPEEIQDDLSQIVWLCPEPSLLGDRLLEAVGSLSGNHEDIVKEVLSVQTELLILSHECHTAASNMEGIANVLRAARLMTVYLESAQEFQLMVRLLVGVGRFNEMIFIFDILKQNHQFELLLKRGLERETKLKMAILDYLKFYHPGDRETYEMVALNFLMYREIGQKLEENAYKHLNELKKKSLENTPAIQDLLQKIAQYFSDAAESYLKENCLRHAQNCIRKARLVALQLKYITTSLIFINLTQQGAIQLITEHSIFSEVFIVSEAYGIKDKWGSALCNNVILRGDLKYLQEFRSMLRLTPTLIQEAIERYQQQSERPSFAINSIKKLLSLCKDVKIQYQAALNLGIKDMVTVLEKGESKSYIQDLISQM